MIDGPQEYRDFLLSFADINSSDVSYFKQSFAHNKKTKHAIWVGPLYKLVESLNDRADLQEFLIRPGYII